MFLLIDNIFYLGFWDFGLGIGMIWVDLGLANCLVQGLADLGAKSITA